MVVQQAEQGYEKETMNERLAKLSGGVAVIQVNSIDTQQKNVFSLSDPNYLV